MCDSRHRPGQAEHQFNSAIYQHKPLGRNGDRKKDQEDFIVGPHDTVRQQQAENATGRADCRVDSPFEHLYQQLDDGCADNTGTIVGEKPLTAPGAFQRCSEHPHGKHIEKQMVKAAMEEGVTDQLPGCENSAADRPKCEPCGLKACKKNQDANNHDTHRYRRIRQK